MKSAAELCTGLLRRACNDRIAMRGSLAAGALDAGCFHAQQMAEKSLKAYLGQRGASFPYTHNLTKLVEACVAIDPAFSSLLPEVAPLTSYAVELRYDDSFWPSQEVAEEARASAETVF
jgi:HEPN domain-containing protein